MTYVDTNVHLRVLDRGDFDGYSATVTISDGKLTIAVGSGANDPKLCLVEVGPQGTSIDSADLTRLLDIVSRATSGTWRSPVSSTAVRKYIYGEYIDELLLFTSNSIKYYYSTNGLYSIAAMTDQSGSVVERYKYSSYGERSVLNSMGSTLDRSSIAQEIGFTGRVHDRESGLGYYRTRMLSFTNGKFNNRMPWSSMMFEIDSTFSEVWPYALAVIPGEDTVNLYKSFGNKYYTYSEGRLSLYDFARSNPSNTLEPFSGTVCAYVAQCMRIPDKSLRCECLCAPAMDTEGTCVANCEQADDIAKPEEWIKRIREASKGDDPPAYPDSPQGESPPEQPQPGPVNPPDCPHEWPDNERAGRPGGERLPK